MQTFKISIYIENGAKNFISLLQCFDYLLPKTFVCFC